MVYSVKGEGPSARRHDSQGQSKTDLHHIFFRTEAAHGHAAENDSNKALAKAETENELKSKPTSACTTERCLTQVDQWKFE